MDLIIWNLYNDPSGNIDSRPYPSSSRYEARIEEIRREVTESRFWMILTHKTGLDWCSGSFSSDRKSPILSKKPLIFQKSSKSRMKFFFVGWGILIFPGRVHSFSWGSLNFGGSYNPISGFFLDLIFKKNLLVITANPAPSSINNVYYFLVL